MNMGRIVAVLLGLDTVPGTTVNRYCSSTLQTTRTAGDVADWSDPRSFAEMPDAYISMGQTAENVASIRGVTREAQDAFAARSQQRADDTFTYQIDQTATDIAEG